MLTTPKISCAHYTPVWMVTKHKVKIFLIFFQKEISYFPGRMLTKGKIKKLLPWDDC